MEKSKDLWDKIQIPLGALLLTCIYSSVISYSMDMPCSLEYQLWHFLFQMCVTFAHTASLPWPPFLVSHGYPPTSYQHTQTHTQHCIYRPMGKIRKITTTVIKANTYWGCTVVPGWVLSTSSVSTRHHLHDHVLRMVNCPVLDIEAMKAVLCGSDPEWDELWRRRGWRMDRGFIFMYYLGNIW